MKVLTESLAYKNTKKIQFTVQNEISVSALLSFMKNKNHHLWSLQIPGSSHYYSAQKAHTTIFPCSNISLFQYLSYYVSYMQLLCTKMFLVIHNFLSPEVVETLT
jgi:hypothetical protein